MDKDLKISFENYDRDPDFQQFGIVRCEAEGNYIQGCLEDDCPE